MVAPLLIGLTGEKRILLYLVLCTGLCNAKCDYCGGSFPEKIVPASIGYTLEDLKRFLSEDKDAIVAFYGGEPLLKTDFIREIMDSIEAKFVIQTNGLLIERLERDYWTRFDTILLSIDGIEWINDLHRGTGGYREVLDAAVWLRRLDFQGDLVARMTVTEQGDIYRDVSHLLSLGLFDHIHWQLDVAWSDRWINFKRWAEYRYKPGTSRIVKLWLEEAMHSRFLGIAPIQGIIRRILHGGVKPPCGSGQDACAISTDGRILACPIAVDVRWSEIGHISVDRAPRLRKISIGEPCTICEEFEACGGRCLYANKEGLLDYKGFISICDVTKHLISEVRTAAHRISQVFGYRILEKAMYPKYNNTIEVIP